MNFNSNRSPYAHIKEPALHIKTSDRAEALGATAMDGETRECVVVSREVKGWQIERGGCGVSC